MKFLLKNLARHLRVPVRCVRYNFLYTKLVFHKILLGFDELIGLFVLFLIRSKVENHTLRIRPLVMVCRFGEYGNGKNQSMEKYCLDNTLQNFNLDIIIFEWDQTTYAGMNKLRFIKCLTRNLPDIIVFSSYTASSKRPISQPGKKLLQNLKKRNFIPQSLVIWWDTCSNTFSKTYLSKPDIFDLHVVVDNPLMDFGSSEIDSGTRKKLLSLFTPYNINSLFSPIEKDIEYCFLGQISSYRNTRKEFIDFLKRQNLGGYLSTQDRNQQMSHEEMGQILGRSKIGINFAFSVGMNQLKGRVFEILFSGAMLLESENEQTASLFENGKDYISFTTKEDMVEKIKFYLANNQERDRIAKNGRNTAIEKYTGTIFWQTIFKKLDLNV